MFNINKNNIFQVEKEMKIEAGRERLIKDESERGFTFKITKKRSPWTTEEDCAITELVNKHGTSNWTVIANEIAISYGFKNRSGKQCRERWHNHLDPNINKDYWTEIEEGILFKKHIEYGNKWSDIARFLPGRTDNAIKNHFYSKLRKFIRKILKQICKENLLKANNVDPNKYNSDYVYKIIKKNKIAYNTLNKETILSLVINHDKNLKCGKGEGGFLKNKSNRKKSVRGYVKKEENLYDQKVRRRLNRGNDVQALIESSRRIIKRAKKENENAETAKKINPVLHYTSTRSRRSLKRNHLNEDFIYDNEMPITTRNPKSVVKRGRNTNTKSNKNISKKEENSYSEDNYESSQSESSQSEEESFAEREDNETSQKYSNIGNYFYPHSKQHNEYVYDERAHRTQYESLNYMDNNAPMISPINSNGIIYPQSTRNHFNIDLIHPDMDYKSNHLQFNYVPFPVTPKTIERPTLSQYTPNKEITLANKILINDSHLVELERVNTPTFKENQTKFEEDKDIQYNHDSFSISRRKSLKRPSIDLNLINDNEIGKIFSESLVCSVQSIQNTENNVESKEKENIFLNNIDKPNKPPISPNNVKAFFNLSPKSAFVKMK